MLVVTASSLGLLQASVNRSRKERVTKSNFRRSIKPSRIYDARRDTKSCASSLIPDPTFDAGPEAEMIRGEENLAPRRWESKPGEGLKSGAGAFKIP
jgi:hypothetical protein